MPAATPVPLAPARRDGDEWVIDGAKAFITNSGTEITSVITVTARTDDGISTFVVESGTPGLVVEPASQARVARARYPRSAARRLPGSRQPHARRPPAAGSATSCRSSTTAVAISAPPSAAPASAWSWLSTTPRIVRRLGGPIGRNQAIAFALADLDVAVEASTNLTYRAAWLKDQGRPFAREAAIAKLYSTEAAVTATRVAAQVFGGSSFIEENPIARFYRDAKILEIGEGTSEIQRLIIARNLGLPVG